MAGEYGPARMMGIADVFETQSTSDRSYKTGRTLTECLFILGSMKIDKHIDPDIFDMFVRDKVYMLYHCCPVNFILSSRPEGEILCTGVKDLSLWSR